MVTAVRDASEAHRQAVARAGILYRDISVSNIKITSNDDEVRGLLIDCRDLGLDFPLKLEGAAQPERTVCMPQSLVSGKMNSCLPGVHGNSLRVGFGRNATARR
ncbi:hypothetical protein FPV67DRAFT_1530276 [Lyophyllum atratum]|nr:hypothetical protein FPV67DRAFT_1530276 [Lyophyllum atratum]